MANIARALKTDLEKIKMTNPNNFRQVIIDDFFFSGVSGSYSSVSSFPSGTILPIEITGYIRSGKGRVFLVCPGCGRRYLLKEENITTPIFDMSCACGTTLEIKEEK